MIKDHPYTDGCKRIASSLFLVFLARNHALYRDGEKVIGDGELTAITLMIAESDPKEKEIMTTMVMNFLLMRSPKKPEIFARTIPGLDITDRNAANRSCGEKVRNLRARSGMNRKEFCKYFRIPYQTVTDWELDKRTAPDYVLRLLEYYIELHLYSDGR